VPLLIFEIIMTREELIAHLEKSIVPQSKWRNRDSSDAQRQLGECLALIKAGCDFHLFCGNGRVHANSTTTLEIEVDFHGFNYFEYGRGSEETETFYAPTPESLAAVNGGDWY
jgi:hypothetical protein